jgi:photosystem II stability/assembly factor-like uncharacterized protein
MAAIKKLTLVALSVLLVGILSAAFKPLTQEKSKAKTYYAVVFLNRGHVTGGTQSNVGLFKRPSGDTTWTNIYRRNLLSFGIGIWEGKSGARYYVAAGNGLHRSVDGTKSWRVLTDWHTEEILSVAPDPIDSAVIYVSTPFGVFKSIDEGRHWEKKMNGMRKWFVKKVVIDVNDRKKLFAVGEEDVYRSTDSGEHWVPLNAGLTDVQSFAQDPASPEHLLAGGEDNDVRLTRDGGKTWQAVQGVPKGSFYALAISPDGHTAYAGGFKTGLWASTDAGVSWKLMLQNPDIEAISTIYIEKSTPSHLMIGTSGQGIYESFDAGKTWRSAGLQGCQVRQIELYP